MNASQWNIVQGTYVQFACPNILEKEIAAVKFPALLAHDGFDSFAYQSVIGPEAQADAHAHTHTHMREHARSPANVHTYTPVRKHLEGEETRFDLSNPQDISHQDCRLIFPGALMSADM